MKKRLFSLLLCCLLLAGCGAESVTILPAEDVAPAPVEDAPFAPVTALTFEQNSSINPYLCSSLSNEALLTLLYESLFTVDANFEAQPLLCSRHTVSEDGLTWTLWLREGAAFSDGTALRPTDVTNSINYARTAGRYISRLAQITSCTVGQEDTVVIQLSSPNPALPCLLDLAITKSGTASSDVPVGTGPYTITVGGQQPCLTRSGGWWQQTDAVPEADTIPLLPLSSAEEIRTAFESGRLSMVCSDPNGQNALPYHGSYAVWSRPTTILHYLAANPARTLFSGADARAALTYAIDRDALLRDVYNGFGLASVLPVSPASAAYNSDLAKTYGYNPAKAQRMLAGLSGETGILLVNADDPVRTQAAGVIAEQLAACGLHLTVTAVPTSEYRTILTAGAYDLCLGELRLTPDFDLTPLFDGSAAFGLQSSELLQLCADARQDPARAAALYQAVLSGSGLCPLLFKSYAVYTAPDVFQALQPGPTGIF